jgi:hypothetical protein
VIAPCKTSLCRFLNDLSLSWILEIRRGFGFFWAGEKRRGGERLYLEMRRGF